VIFYHTHFSNRDPWAFLHLEETITLSKSENELPIIVGDLNIKSAGEIVKNNYKISWMKSKYCSYPSKNDTLDYVLIPKKWTFGDINCTKDGLSDHRPLITHIKKNINPKH